MFLVIAAAVMISVVFWVVAWKHLGEALGIARAEPAQLPECQRIPEPTTRAA